MNANKDIIHNRAPCRLERKYQSKKEDWQNNGLLLHHYIENGEIDTRVSSVSFYIYTVTLKFAPRTAYKKRNRGANQKCYYDTIQCPMNYAEETLSKSLCISL